VTRIEVLNPEDADPKTCASWIQVDIPDQVVHHLRERNQRHFGQAAGTPFTVPPLSGDLGFDGQGEGSEQILKGTTYNHEGNDHIVRLLLEYLKQTEAIAAMETTPTILKKDCWGKLQVWRESTTTSPSGLYLGHYKAMISCHKYYAMIEEENDKYKAKQDT
jgi:hypothetical protein